MGTHALVAMQRPDGLFNVSYISYDGYESGVGARLFKFWNDPEKIEELTRGHWISSLADDIEDLDFNDVEDGDDVTACPQDTHDTDTSSSQPPFIGCSEFQIRFRHDRGYNYVYRDGKWFLLGHYCSATLDKMIEQETNEFRKQLYTSYKEYAVNYETNEPLKADEPDHELTRDFLISRDTQPEYLDNLVKEPPVNEMRGMLSLRAGDMAFVLDHSEPPASSEAASAEHAHMRLMPNPQTQTVLTAGNDKITADVLQALLGKQVAIRYGALSSSASFGPEGATSTRTAAVVAIKEIEP